MKIPKQNYTPEFRELAVKRVKEGQGIASVARELVLMEQTLRNWVKASDARKLNGPGTTKVTAGEMEFSRLRAGNIRLRQELSIIKKLRRTSRRISCKVRLDCRPEGFSAGDDDVRCSVSQCQRLSSLETWWDKRAKMADR